jgi:hypothetical protein
MDNVDKFLRAARSGWLPRVQKVLAGGETLITDVGQYRRTALLYAAQGGSRALPTLKWLLEEGGARITDRDGLGNTALIITAHSNTRGWNTMCQWLLEHGGADIAETNDAGRTVWTMLAGAVAVHHEDSDEGVDEATALLRAMMVWGDPPADFGGTTVTDICTTRAQAGGGRRGVAEGGPACVPRAAAGPLGRALPLAPVPPCPGPQIRSGAYHHGGALGHGARRGSLILPTTFTQSTLAPPLPAHYTTPQHPTQQCQPLAKHSGGRLCARRLIYHR